MMLLPFQIQTNLLRIHCILRIDIAFLFVLFYVLKPELGFLSAWDIKGVGYFF